MKGIVFNLLEKAVRTDFGDEAWDQLIVTSKVSGAYTSLGNYPDSDLVRLVGAASSSLKLLPDEVLRWFGKRALGFFHERYPALFQSHENTRSFILALNEIIHPEVRKLYPGADVPVFKFDTSSQNVLLLEYYSKRRLCAFAEGLIAGAADHFGEHVNMHQSRCMHRGDDCCKFELAFRKPQS
jgi:hypothetical protein